MLTALGQARLVFISREFNQALDGTKFFSGSSPTTFSSQMYVIPGSNLPILLAVSGDGGSPATPNNLASA